MSNEIYKVGDWVILKGLPTKHACQVLTRISEKCSAGTQTQYTLRIWVIEKGKAAFMVVGATSKTNFNEIEIAGKTEPLEALERL